MNFHPGQRDEPEINLIPFIDILLVILIFLMLTTTYSQFTQLQVNLPVSHAEPQRPAPPEIVIAVSSEGRYAINREVLEGAGVDTLTNALARAAQGNATAMLIISADAAATHQSVITVMDAARRAGLVQVTFAARQLGEQP
ncbi:MAG: ExbD/TolR family protein [Hydrogenophaga sp.]